MMKSQTFHRTSMVIVATAAMGAQLVTAALAWGDDGPSQMQSNNGQPPNGPPSPPPEAFTACQGHTAGDACTVTFGGHEMQGTCASDSSQGLFCRPAGPPHGPPPEALEACRNHSAGDACSVTFRDGRTDTGTCTAGPDGGELGCRPDHPPQHP